MERHWKKEYCLPCVFCDSGANRGGATILSEGGQNVIREKVGVQFFPCGGYEEANNYQYWIHWNLLSGCRINKYAIGLYYSIVNQWRREFHVSAVNNIYNNNNNDRSTAFDPGQPG